MMGIDWDIKNLKERLQRLENIPDDKVFVCTICGKRLEKVSLSDHLPDTCYPCERADKKRKALVEAEQMLIGARVVGVSLKDSDAMNGILMLRC